MQKKVHTQNQINIEQQTQNDQITNNIQYLCEHVVLTYQLLKPLKCAEIIHLMPNHVHVPK